MKGEPKFTKMTARESRAMLRRHGFGRLAFTFKDRVSIQPIGYVLDGQWLYGRTSHGMKLVQLKHNPWVAFEVDEVEGPFDWRSVVVNGTVYFLNPDGQEHEAFPQALKLFRRMDKRVLQPGDLAPHRTTFFRIHLDEVSGLQASTKQVRRPRAG